MGGMNMGADGHIEIYDWTKTVKKFPELEKNDKLRFLVQGSAYIYKNPVGEGEWLVGYWGDNLIHPTFPGYESWWAEEYAQDFQDLNDKAIEIVLWMRSEAVIVEDWEVWT